MTRATVLVLALMTGCGGGNSFAPLNEDLFGRWEGTAQFAYGSHAAESTMNIGVSVTDDTGYITDLCPVFGGGTLFGPGTGNKIDAGGWVRCKPVIADPCFDFTIDWYRASVELDNDGFLLVVAGGTESGTHSGCDLEPRELLATARLSRVIVGQSP